MRVKPATSSFSCLTLESRGSPPPSINFLATENGFATLTKLTQQHKARKAEGGRFRVQGLGFVTRTVSGLGFRVRFRQIESRMPSDARRKTIESSEPETVNPKSETLLLPTASCILPVSLTRKKNYCDLI